MIVDYQGRVIGEHGMERGPHTPELSWTLRRCVNTARDRVGNWLRDLRTEQFR